MHVGEEMTWRHRSIEALYPLGNRGGRPGLELRFEPSRGPLVPKVELAFGVEAQLGGKAEFPGGSHPRPYG